MKTLSDLISREDAINAVAVAVLDDKDELEAIKAIPSVQVSGDLISRQDAIEAVMAEGRKVYTSECANAERIIYEADAVEALSMLPSAETTCATCADRALCIMSEPDGNWKACKDYRPSAEAVQGEWKRVPTRTYKGECTNCGFRHIFMDGHDSQYRFCPYCGARMTPYKGGEDK